MVPLPLRFLAFKGRVGLALGDLARGLRRECTIALASLGLSFNVVDEQPMKPGRGGEQRGALDKCPERLQFQRAAL